MFMLLAFYVYFRQKLTVRREGGSHEELSWCIFSNISDICTSDLSQMLFLTLTLSHLSMRAVNLEPPNIKNWM